MKRPNHPLLGDVPLSAPTFDLKKTLSEFASPAFRSLHVHQKQNQVAQRLYDLIRATPSPCFLLPAVVDYIDKVNALKAMDLYTLSHFELWLNQFSSLSEEENYAIRAKVVGKSIPRSAYQTLFPIGMGKKYAGSHLVTAHGSPDLDTTIASFWGWVDAFGAQVSEGLHLWNIPGGPPQGVVEIPLLFNHVFGETFFSAVAKTRTALSLSSLELMTQKGFAKETADTSILEVNHEGDKQAIVLVDNRGYYLGDWRNTDVEGVRQVISLFNHSLRWFSYTVQMHLFSLLSKEKLSATDITAFLDRTLLSTLRSYAPVLELTAKQRALMQDFLVKVLHVGKGLEATFHEFAQAMQSHSLPEFKNWLDLVEKMNTQLPSLLEQRPSLFSYLQKMMQGFDRAFESVRTLIEKLHVALTIKAHVFGQESHPINSRAEVDEIKMKMGSYGYLSVLSSEGTHALPIGIVRAQDLAKPVLGTVTLRDFCNREETKIPSYLEVISVIDHHKSQLGTSSAPMLLIADAQSSNVLCAEAAFIINDQFSTGGMTREHIDKQVQVLIKEAHTPAQRRCLSRLLRRQSLFEESPHYFIDPLRERVEYTHFLYGILDDTDLLSKVSMRDLECVVQLINRLKSLCTGEEVEILSLNDLPKDSSLLQKAAQRILQHPDVYSLYQKVYAAKQRAVEDSIVQGATGKSMLFFVDTKEQNGCARVGQTKLFPANYPLFAKQAPLLQKHWQAVAQEFFANHEEVDLHMQMISTISGAEEVSSGSQKDYPHQDELWIWIPFSEASVGHLKEFLSAFATIPLLRSTSFSADFYGEKAADYAQLFAESFPLLSSHTKEPSHKISFARLKYKAGLINSRKAMISPYLPKLVK